MNNILSNWTSVATEHDKVHDMAIWPSDIAKPTSWPVHRGLGTIAIDWRSREYWAQYWGACKRHVPQKQKALGQAHSASKE